MLFYHWGNVIYNKLTDVENPGKGVILNMSSSQSRIRCSLTVSVNCDPSNAQVFML